MPRTRARRRSEAFLLADLGTLLRPAAAPPRSGSPGGGVMNSGFSSACPSL